MRCFIAIDLDQSLAKKVEPLQKELKDFDVKLVELHNLHFTLKFLGNINEKAINDVKVSLDKLAAGFASFDIEIKHAGVFPNEKFIRVVWVGAEKLSGLQLAVNESLVKYFKKEKPSPHLTIARVRSQKYSKEITGFVSRHRNDIIGNMNVNTIKLKKSAVTSKGPIYEDMAVFSLAKAMSCKEGS